MLGVPSFTVKYGLAVMVRQVKSRPPLVFVSRRVVQCPGRCALWPACKTVAWKAARPRLIGYQLGRTRGGVRRGVKRSWCDDPDHHCHDGAPRSPSRTAVRAKMADTGGPITLQGLS